MVLVLQTMGCSLPFQSRVTPPTSEQVIAKENAYQQFVQVVKTTDWKKAEPKEWADVDNSINELTSYKDTSMISRYLNYFRYLNENHLDVAIGIANHIPLDYSGDLRDEINTIKAEAKTLAIDQDMKYYAELIRKGDYETVRNETVEKVSLGVEYNALYNYLSAIEYQKKGIRSAMIVSLAHISMPYYGLLSEEITKMVNQNSDEIYLMRNLLSGETSKGMPKPLIGMTTAEVLASSWSTPDKVISATTTTGNIVQWEYARDRVIFFENGFVTAIQY